MNTVEMPDRIAEDLILYIRKNRGKLGKKRRNGQFAKLRDEEVVAIEEIVGDVFTEG